MTEIEENTKLIAEFMGIRVLLGLSTKREEYYFYNNFEEQDFDALPNYNSSWDSLMPVVEKIGDIEYVKCEGVRDKIEKIFPHSINGLFLPIDMVYKLVVTFIKWYNEQKK